MLIVRPYGRSITEKANQSRRLKLNTPNQPYGESADFEKFNSQNGKILIAQWISVIDKIIRKPGVHEVKSGNKPEGEAEIFSSYNDEVRAEQLNARTKLGAACWQLLKPKLEVLDDNLTQLEQIWNAKLHPHGSHAKSFKNFSLKRDEKGELVIENGRPVKDDTFELEIEGRWFERFSQGNTPSTLDYSSVAKNIKRHLEQAEFLFSEKAKNGERRNTGLIEARAKSIAKNTLANRIIGKCTDRNVKRSNIDFIQKSLEGIENIRWSEEEEHAFLKAGDLASQIHQLCLKKEKNYERINRREVGELIFAHYGKLFFNAKEGRVFRRNEVQEKAGGILNLYDDIRAYYKRIIRSSAKGRKMPKGRREEAGQRFGNLSQILPKHHGELVQKLCQRQRNAITNDLIRIGRILHYESSEGMGDGFALRKGSAAWENSVEKLADSWYLTSEGQAEIKRTEAFVRVWRNSSVQAARTARPFCGLRPGEKDAKGRYADPLDIDFAKQAASKPEAQKAAQNQALLLFGKRAELFINSYLPGGSFVYASLRVLAKFRNLNIHFNGRRTFVETIVSSMSNPENYLSLNEDESWQDFIGATKSLLKNDRVDRGKRLVDEMNTAAIHHYADQNELQYFKDLIENAPDCDFILPKFKTLLKRLQNTDMLVPLQFHFLPAPPSRFLLEQDLAFKAKYLAMKMLYETDFRQWIEDLPNQLLIEFVQKSIARNTAAAREIYEKSFNAQLILSKAESLALSAENKTISEYLDQLQALVASEIRIQNGYENDSEKARENSEWIENIRRDIIGRSFAHYLLQFGSKLRWLCDLKPGDQSVAQSSCQRLILSHQTNEPEAWQAQLYFYLHFVSIDDVSRLTHQFRKWGQLEKKADISEQDADQQIVEYSTQDGEKQKKDVDTLIDEMRDLLSLYLDMKDDKHTGGGIELRGLEPIQEKFFNSPNEFNAAFRTQGTDDEKLGSTRRGLREILRFGDLEVLTAAGAKTKISQKEINTLLNLESASTRRNVAKAQTERYRLHKHITGEDLRLEGKKGKAEPTEKEFRQYELCLSIIREHDRLAGKVRLNSLIELHKLMSRLVSKLVDYAGIWERDRYFITLALLILKRKKPQDVLGGEAKDFLKSAKLEKLDKIDQDFKKLLLRFHTSDREEVLIRNEIDHFTFMAGLDVDLTDIANKTRKLMRYDRKLKNAVAKSMIDLVAQEGMDLDWVMEDHQLRFKSLTSRSIIHLAKQRQAFEKKSQAKASKAFKEGLVEIPVAFDLEAFTQPRKEDEFLAMAEQLFVQNEREQSLNAAQ